MKKMATLFFLSSALVLSGCNTSTESVHTSTSSEVKDEAPIAVTVQTINTGDLINSNSFSGRTASSSDTSITAEMAGKVSKVNVSVGDYVQKGDVLLTIDGSDLNKSIEQARVALETAQTSYSNATGASVTSQLNQLENAVKNAQLNYDESKRNYDIYVQLYEAESITEDQFKKIELTLTQAEMALNTAQESYELTKNEVIPQSQALAQKSVDQAQLAYDTAVSNLGKLSIVAPTSGTITTANFKAGEMIAQTAPAFVISNLNTLEVNLQVTETDVKKFKVGDKVTAKLDGESVEATVTDILAVPNAQTGLYTVKITINNAENKFLAGMAVEIELTTEKSESTLIIPKKALLEEEDATYVYLCVDNKAVKTPVETGLETSSTIEITSGINEGQVLVVGGISLITDGENLYPVEKEE